MVNRGFRNRLEAGRLLAGSLRKYAGLQDLIVLGLPRGGVPVAYEIARAVHAPLDVFVVRKLGCPGQPELAMGAIATGGVRVLNEEVAHGPGMSEAVLARITASEGRELERRESAYRGGHSAPEVTGKTVILVDDGVATGSTMRAAIQAMHAQIPARLTVAAPVIALSTYEELRREVDECVALLTPEPFYAVGNWYEDFGQTSDVEVTEILKRARHEFTE
jgi:predicted phosphoribosyltransferase